jgi:hypothetical protein
MRTAPWLTICNMPLPLPLPLQHRAPSNRWNGRVHHAARVTEAAPLGHVPHTAASN